MRLVFDGHLDLSWNALSWDREQSLPLEAINAADRAFEDDDARGRATTCLPEMQRGGVLLCLATLLVRSRPDVRPPAGRARIHLDFASPLVAYATAQGQLAYYRLLEANGLLRSIRTRRDLEAHARLALEVMRPEAAPAAGAARATRPPPIGYVLAMEGADPIVEPAQAEAWWRDGLRCVNLVHYGRGPYAAGTGSEGPLTPRGIELLDELERLGFILDLTHLSDEAFFQAVERFSGPVHASHQNCRALVPGQRQFTDEQLRIVIERGGVIGAALDSWMLAPGWQTGVTPREAATLESVADHIEHVCALAGNARHTAIGSDLDGGFGTEQSPAGLETIADLQKLGAILQRRGFSSADIDAVFHGNWLRFFLESLPEA